MYVSLTCVNRKVLLTRARCRNIRKVVCFTGILTFLDSFATSNLKIVLNRKIQLNTNFLVVNAQRPRYQVCTDIELITLHSDVKYSRWIGAMRAPSHRWIGNARNNDVMRETYP